MDAVHNSSLTNLPHQQIVHWTSQVFFDYSLMCPSCSRVHAAGFSCKHDDVRPMSDVMVFESCWIENYGYESWKSQCLHKGIRVLIVVSALFNAE
jgi:hypothetical protein